MEVVAVALQSEEYIALINNKLNQFNEIWDNLCMDIMDLKQVREIRNNINAFVRKQENVGNLLGYCISSCSSFYVKEICLTMSFLKSE